MLYNIYTYNDYTFFLTQKISAEGDHTGENRTIHRIMAITILILGIMACGFNWTIVGHKDEDDKNSSATTGLLAFSGTTIAVLLFVLLWTKADGLNTFAKIKSKYLIHVGTTLALAAVVTAQFVIN